MPNFVNHKSLILVLKSISLIQGYYLK